MTQIENKEQQGNNDNNEVWKVVRSLFEEEETMEQSYGRRKYSGDSNNGGDDKYKTEKCRYWAMYQTCPFGDKCVFAHGNEEIRKRQFTSVNYKTKVCSNFSKTGACKYGERCQFLHEQNESSVKHHKAMSYLQYLKRLPQKIEENIPIKRLRFFSDMTQDNYENINWTFKRTRMYSA